VLIPAGIGHFMECGIWNGQNRGIYGIPAHPWCTDTNYRILSN
jgi:hypothetical protein